MSVYGESVFDKYVIYCEKCLFHCTCETKAVCTSRGEGMLLGLADEIKLNRCAYMRDVMCEFAKHLHC